MKPDQAINTYHPFAQEYKGSKHLAGEDLSGWCLVRANLEGADLTRCNLTDADLCGANLKNANTDGVILDHTYLNGCDLRGANVKAWQCRDLQGFHTRGAIFDYLTVDVATIQGAHDCHEMAASVLLRHFGLHDESMVQFAEATLARLIPCWHGGVQIVRRRWPDRISDIEDCWRQYPNMQLMHRWELGVAMADCHTAEDWENLKTSVHNARFPALVRGWAMRETQKLRSQ